MTGLTAGSLRIATSEPPPRFQPIERDLTVDVPDSTPAAEVARRIGDAGGPALGAATLVGTYRGQPLGLDERSLTYRLRFDRAGSRADGRRGGRGNRTPLLARWRTKSEHESAPEPATLPPFTIPPGRGANVEQIQPFDLVIVACAAGDVHRRLRAGRRSAPPRHRRDHLRARSSARSCASRSGEYLSHQWTSIVPSYSFMVAFGAVFVAAAVTLSIGIQITYRPAPLFPKYPVLDEIVGGLLGVVEGFLILIAILLILDPHFNSGVGPCQGRAR